MKLHNAFVCYLDILGIKEKTGKGALNDLNRQIEQLGGFMQEVNRRQNGYGNRYALGSCKKYVKVFSDNIVLVMPIKIKDKTDMEYRLKYLLGSIDETRNEASLAGLLIRGGISIGKAVSSDFMIAGDALIRAYHIESKVSKYPRIVIDRQIAKFLDFEQLKDIALDADGEWFFHYLNWIDSARLYGHKRYIERCVKDVGPDIGKHIEKYKWLIDYHNACCPVGFEEWFLDKSMIGIGGLKTTVFDWKGLGLLRD